MDFRHRRKIDHTIDMTPMIDTLLQLFVVFLLSMSFITSAVRLDLPKASLDQPAAESLVVVTFDAADQVFVNDERVARPELRWRLQGLLAQAKSREVLLRADRALIYDKILQMLVEMQEAGATNVHLAYAPSDSP